MHNINTVASGGGGCDAASAGYGRTAAESDYFIPRVLFQYYNGDYKHCLAQIAVLESGSNYNNEDRMFTHSTLNEAFYADEIKKRDRDLTYEIKPHDTDYFRTTGCLNGNFEVFSIQDYNGTTASAIGRHFNEILSKFPRLSLQTGDYKPTRYRISCNGFKFIQHLKEERILEGDIDRWVMKSDLFISKMHAAFLDTNKGGLYRAVKFALNPYAKKGLRCTPAILIALQAAYLKATGFFKDHPIAETASKLEIRNYVAEILRGTQAEKIHYMLKYLPLAFHINSHVVYPDIFIEYLSFIDTKDFIRTSILRISDNTRGGHYVVETPCKAITKTNPVGFPTPDATPFRAVITSPPMPAASHPAARYRTATVAPSDMPTPPRKDDNCCTIV
ncbi:MAG: hypothetical protein Q7V63_01305 [Gammaproteobacteria bacterium]|nr:hypothetical protein [Gammaproteobacteria bacterium]